MFTTEASTKTQKRRGIAAFIAAALLMTALSGCVVEPVGYYGHPHYWARY